MVKTLRTALSKARLGSVSVAFRGNKLTLGDIPPAQLTALAKALLAVQLPTE